MITFLQSSISIATQIVLGLLMLVVLSVGAWIVFQFLKNACQRIWWHLTRQ
jgi:hypothetical protein